MCHTRLASLVFATVSLVAPRVLAESSLGPNVAVAVEPAADCPTETEFVIALGGALSREAIASAPPARFGISFRPEEPGTRGTLFVSSEDARPLSRTVRAATCREAAEALALVIVLIIDPLSVANPKFEDKEHAAEKPPTPVEGPRPAPRRSPAPPRSPPPRMERPSVVRLGATGSAGVTAGVTPGLAPTVDLGAIAALRSFPLELHGGAGVLAPTSAHLDRGSVQFWAVRARGAACAIARPQRWTLGACAGANVDWVLTKATNFARTTTTTVVIPSAVTSGFGRYALGASPWSVGLEAELGVVLVRTAWNVIAAGEAHHTSTLAGRLGALVVYEF